MDELDRRIMKELMLDAQLPYVKIAERIGTSAETVRKRYDRMKEGGMILQSSISMDFRKLGFEGLAVLMILSRDVTKTLDGLRVTSNVIAVNRTIGEHDIMAFALTRDVDDLFDIVSRVQRIDQVEHVEVILCRLTGPSSGGGIFHRMVPQNGPDVVRR
ncbi:MAG TPA: AsnC family transcriptional regulator [Methanomassiliicoccales archaeon]|jgi:Lrp/AsnC family transcriptional regulator for asnA, asnC and gidA